MSPIVEPEAVHMSSDRLNRLDETLQAYVALNQVAGLTTRVVRQGQVVQQACYGKLNVEAGSLVRPDSLFRLTSLTKPIVAVAALMLQEQGGFNLHDPVARWIPEFENLKVYPRVGSPGRNEYVDLEWPLTFWHLLTHTAGFGYGVEPDDPVGDQYRQAGFFSPIFVLQLPLPEMIHRLGQLPLANQPGEGFRYSVSYDVLGYLIELISGQPLAEYLHERIFEPLGMLDTGFTVPANKLDRLGPLYSGPSERGILPLEERSTSPFEAPGPIASGGGGLMATLPDYVRFLSLLLNGGELDGMRLLAPATVAQMITSQVEIPWRPGMGYGFGVGVQVEDQRPEGLPPGVFGWDSAAGPAAWADPQTGLIAAIMYQSFVFQEPAKRFRSLAFGALLP